MKGPDLLSGPVILVGPEWAYGDSEVSEISSDTQYQLQWKLVAFTSGLGTSTLLPKIPPRELMN
jgi:hypothetical protein